ncbi:MAG: hypothetical protein HY892_05705 [Deltaproteobacteria bacterium]|nr:hypothetical protein [Deltaproteobacteria bacterium]
MKRYRWELTIGAGFLGLSALFYLVQIVIFRSPRDTFFYFFQDLAFVPIQVLLVTLIINQLLTIREKRNLIKKLNMVVGVFFAEAGTHLLRLFYALEPNAETIKKDLIIRKDWAGQDFLSRIKTFKHYPYHLKIDPGSLQEIKGFLLGKRAFLLSLLENPNLLEHDSFTDLLLAVFHLTDELAARDSLSGLPESDLAHLRGDIKRAMGALISEWLGYLKHLQEDYPYLFSLEIRKNPSDPRASVVIRDPDN